VAVAASGGAASASANETDDATDTPLASLSALSVALLAAGRGVVASLALAGAVEYVDVVDEPRANRGVINGRATPDGDASAAAEPEPGAPAVAAAAAAAAALAMCSLRISVSSSACSHATMAAGGKLQVSGVGATRHACTHTAVHIDQTSGGTHPLPARVPLLRDSAAQGADVRSHGAPERADDAPLNFVPALEH